MHNNRLSSFIVSMVVMAAGMSLSACSGSNSEADAEDAEIVTAPTTTETPSSSAKAADLDGAVVEQGIPISYDVAAWNNKEVKPVGIDELDAIQAAFGKVVTSDKNSLDYASNPATKYRFMESDEPYLDIIDSQKYLELGWYYANPTDSDTEKQQSEDHAKKAYTLARQLMGDEGGKVLSDILSGQIIKDRTIGGQKIELAKCEFYSCMFILNKEAAEISQS